ncbi:MAG: universal stress protein [Gammaproteobacteria bacterium]|nr:universal stress protein [Gammaproteobacteria bacterium]
MSPTERGLERILVALDASASGRAALAAAAALAAELQAELLGLFVEDANLLRLASLPLGARSAWGPAAAETRDEETMARALRAEAARLRDLLAREAERLHLRWSFRVARGAVARELVEAAERVDLVVMGSAGGNPAIGGSLGSTARAVAQLSPSSVAFLRPGAVPGRPVAVLCDGSGAALRALAVAGRLAREDGRNLVALVPSRAQGRAPSLTSEVEARLRAQGLEAKVHEVPSESPGALAAEVRAAGGHLLVLPAGHPLCEATAFAALLERVGCPVVIAR